MSMSESDWERWCDHIGGTPNSQNPNTVWIEESDTVVANEDEELVIDQRGVETRYEPDLVVPKAHGLEIHENGNVFDVEILDTDKERMVIEDSSPENADLDWTLLVDEELSMTNGERRGFELGLEDLAAIETAIDIPHFEIILTSDEKDVAGSCGEFRGGNEIWVAVSECASRGYSDYRWRVNRTPHGVIIHELGHYIHQVLVNNRHTRDSYIHELFPSIKDITKYSGKNYRENFAESFRVYVSNPVLLDAINPEKVAFFDQHFDVPVRDLEECIDEFTGVIQYQLRTASTNEHIRSYLDDRDIQYE